MDVLFVMGMDARVPNLENFLQDLNVNISQVYIEDDQFKNVDFDSFVKVFLCTSFQSLLPSYERDLLQSGKVDSLILLNPDFDEYEDVIDEIKNKNSKFNYFLYDEKAFEDSHDFFSPELRDFMICEAHRIKDHLRYDIFKEEASSATKKIQDDFDSKLKTIRIVADDKEVQSKKEISSLNSHLLRVKDCLQQQLNLIASSRVYLEAEHRCKVKEILTKLDELNAILDEDIPTSSRGRTKVYSLVLAANKPRFFHQNVALIISSILLLIWIGAFIYLKTTSHYLLDSDLGFYGCIFILASHSLCVLAFLLSYSDHYINKHRFIKSMDLIDKQYLVPYSECWEYHGILKENIQNAINEIKMSEDPTQLNLKSYGKLLRVSNEIAEKVAENKKMAS